MSMHSHKGGKWPLYLVFSALFVVMLAFSAMSPMIDDDYSYCFSWADVSRITSIGQIPASMAMHRHLTNGRVFAHGLVQLLLIRPKAAFVVLNACNALLLGYLFLRYFRQLSPARAGLLLLLGAMMLWNFSTDFFRTFLWLDGAVNYSWGISLILLFLWPYVAAYWELPQKQGRWRSALFLLLAFIAGGYSENSSLAALFIAGVLTLWLMLRRRKLPWLLPVGLALALAGYVFLMSAPATAGRAGDTGLAALTERLLQILRYSLRKLSPLYLFYGVCLLLALAFKVERRKLALSLLFLLAGIASLSAFLFAYYFTDRHCCFTVFFTVLAALILLSALPAQKQLRPTCLLAACVGLLFLFNFARGGLDIAVGYRKALQREAMIREALAAGQTEITLPCYSASTQYAGSFFLYENPREWPNDSVALYYGFEQVRGAED